MIDRNKALQICGKYVFVPELNFARRVWNRGLKGGPARIVLFRPDGSRLYWGGYSGWCLLSLLSGYYRTIAEAESVARTIPPPDCGRIAVVPICKKRYAASL